VHVPPGVGEHEDADAARQEADQECEAVDVEGELDAVARDPRQFDDARPAHLGPEEAQAGQRDGGGRVRGALPEQAVQDRDGERPEERQGEHQEDHTRCRWHR
jgi:hypothetical protein